MLRPHSYQPPEDGLPPQDVRILDLHVESWPEDQNRVRIHLEMTPFLERPDIEVVLIDGEGQAVTSINIVESIDAKMTFTMHIRGEILQPAYTVEARVIYPEIGSVDQKSLLFQIIGKEEKSEDS